MSHTHNMVLVAVQYHSWCTNCVLGILISISSFTITVIKTKYISKLTTSSMWFYVQPPHTDYDQETLPNLWAVKGNALPIL